MAADFRQLVTDARTPPMVWLIWSSRGDACAPSLPTFVASLHQAVHLRVGRREAECESDVRHRFSPIAAAAYELV